MAKIIEAKTTIDTAGVEAGAQIIRDQYVSAVKVVKEQFAQWKQAQQDLDAAIANGGRNLQGQFVSMAALRANVDATRTSLQQATVAAAATKKEFDAVSEAAKASGINMRYLFFAAKDLGEGRTRFAIAEMANELIRLQGVAKLAGLGLVAIAAAGFGIYELREHFRGITEAAAAAAAPFRNLRVELEETNDKMQLSNDKLEDEIRKLQGKPSNGLKVALDEAIVSADELAAALDKDIQKLAEAADKANVGGFGAFFKHQASTTDIKELIQGVTGFGGAMQKIKDDTDAGTKAIRATTDAKTQDALRTQLNSKLTDDYADAIGKLTTKLDASQQAQAASPGAFGLNYTKRIEELKGVISDLEAQKNSIQLRQTADSDAQTKEILEKQKAASEQANTALREADEQKIEELKASGDASLETIEAAVQSQIAAAAKFPAELRRLNTELLNIQREEHTKQVEDTKKAGEEETRYQQEVIKNGLDYLAARQEFVARSTSLDEDTYEATRRITAAEMDTAKEEQKVFTEEIRQAEEHDRLIAEADRKAEEEARHHTEEMRRLLQEQGAAQTDAIELQKAQVEAKESVQKGGIGGLSTNQEVAYLQQLKAIDAQIIAEKERTMIQILQLDSLAAQANPDDKQAQDKYLQDQKVFNQLVLQGQQTMLKDNVAILNAEQSQYTKFFNQLNQEATHAFNDLLTHPKKFTQDLNQIWTKMVTDFADKLLLMGLKWIENQVLMTTVHATAQQTQVAATATAATQTQSINALTTLKSITNDAVKAAAGAYQAVVGIPIVGPVLAPIAAGVAFAGVEALGALASLDTGTNLVPRTGVYQLHQNEAVVPAKYNPAYGGSVFNNGGNVINNHQTISAGSGPNAARQAGAASITQLKSFARRSNFFMK